MLVLLANGFDHIYMVILLRVRYFVIAISMQFEVLLHFENLLWNCQEATRIR